MGSEVSTISSGMSHIFLPLITRGYRNIRHHQTLEQCSRPMTKQESKSTLCFSKRGHGTMALPLPNVLASLHGDHLLKSEKNLSPFKSPWYFGWVTMIFWWLNHPKKIPQSFHSQGTTGFWCFLWAQVASAVAPMLEKMALSLSRGYGCLIKTNIWGVLGI